MGIGPQDGLQHLFILQAASAETRQRLTAAADGGLGEQSATQRCLSFQAHYYENETSWQRRIISYQSAAFLHLLDRREKVKTPRAILPPDALGSTHSALKPGKLTLHS